MSTLAAVMPAVVDSADPPEVALIAHVASKRVRQELRDNPHRYVLFRIVGLESDLTCAIARRIKRDIPGATVEVHEELADDTLPSAMLSRRNVADYRNAPRPPGGGAIVFSVPTRQLDVVGKTADDIQQISEEVLLQMPELWIDCSHELAGLDNRGRRNVVNILKGIATAGILTRGLRMFGDFAHRLGSFFANEPLEQALDDALPALRIPREAGRFKAFGKQGRLRSPEAWASKFKELHETADDALYLRKADGAPLSRTALRSRLADLTAEGAIDDDEHGVLSALINDGRIEPGHWTSTQQAAAGLRWKTVERLVKASKRKVQQPLGEATLELFDAGMPNELNDVDRKLLAAMGDGAASADEDERDFFFRQRSNIAEESKNLLKRWEQYVFRKSEPHADPALGLFMTIADLIGGTEVMPEAPRVYVRLQGADRRAFWHKQNIELCRFLRDRYRGLPELFRPAGVVLDFGMCWTGDWDDQAQNAPNNSRAAREFKFDIFLVSANDWKEGGKPADATLKAACNAAQMLWSLPADSVASSYTDNMLEVANLQGGSAFLASGRFSRAQSQDRSSDGRISLIRRATFQDINGRPFGMLIDPNDAQTAVGRMFEARLASLRGDVLSDGAADDLERSYRAFVDLHTEAVRAMVVPGGAGLASRALLRQAEAYGSLLADLRTLARKDACRAGLWLPMLSLGIAYSLDQPTVAICTPWHPFKLAAAAAKAARMADALVRMLGSGPSDVRTFSRNVARTMNDGWHPAITLFQASPCPRLLAETDSFADFGLMEAPTADQGAADAFDGYSEQAARELLTQADEYLELQPHERANFSIVLYNADNRSLPSHLADSLASKIETEKDLRCDLILTHSDQRRLRQIYAEQNVAISARLDGVLANEATQGFLSRLRVGFLDIGGFGRGEPSVQAADLVFLHDVIARSARTGWRKTSEPDKGWPNFVAHSPDAETRRRHFERGTRKTESLLVPAERPLEVQRYLDLVRDCHLDFRDEPDGHHVPVREINFDESGVGTVIDQAHRVARWVVTYDAIADLQLFRNNNVNIIRFLTKPGSDHNLVVSTRQHGAVLLSKLADEIGTILASGGAEARNLARVCIDEAARISGRVVLRAARLENNALELLGLVLSKQVVVDSLPKGTTPVCWLLLDDFADWLGHKGRKADILTACLSEDDGVPVVDLIVVESKFVGLAAETAAMLESFDQMRASTTDLRDRIVLGDDALNRRTWLGRLADLLLEHGTFPGPIAGRDPQAWARLIRSDEAVLRIRGLSLVFVHDRLDGLAEPLTSQTHEQRQFSFNRDQVAEGLRRVQAAMQGKS